jgi:hypothetical protein
LILAGGQNGEEVENEEAENEDIENEEVENEEVEIQASVEKTYKGKTKAPRSHSAAAKCSRPPKAAAAKCSHSAAAKCENRVSGNKKRYQRPHKALTPSRTKPLDHMAELAA